VANQLRNFQYVPIISTALLIRLHPTPKQTVTGGFQSKFFITNPRQHSHVRGGGLNGGRPNFSKHVYICHFCNRISVSLPPAASSAAAICFLLLQPLLLFPLHPPSLRTVCKIQISWSPTRMSRLSSSVLAHTGTGKIQKHLPVFTGNIQISQTDNIQIIQTCSKQVW
jgi:hypothetical protein